MPNPNILPILNPISYMNELPLHTTGTNLTRQKQQDNIMADGRAPGKARTTSVGFELPIKSTGSRPLSGAFGYHHGSAEMTFSSNVQSESVTPGASVRSWVNLAWWQKVLRTIDPRRSIKGRLSMAMFLVSILFLGTSSCIVGVTGINFLRTSSGNSLMEYAAMVANSIDASLYGRYRDIRIIASMPWVRDPNTTPDDLQVVLDETKATYSLYSWIGIAYNNGTVKAAANGLLKNRDVSGRPWFIACRNASFINPPRYVGDVHGALLLQSALNISEPLRLLDVALPLFDRNGTQIGVIGAHINASMTFVTEKEVMGRLPDRASLQLFILSQEGVVQGVSGENTTDAIPRGPGSPAMLAHSGQTGWTVGDWPSGEQYLTGFAPTQGVYGIKLDWTIMVRKLSSTAFALSNKLILILGLAHLGFGIVLVGSSYLVAHITTAPLVGIARAADNIRKKSAIPHIPVVKGMDEIARLSISLQALVSNLVEKEINLKGINQDLCEKVEALQRAEARLRASEEKFRQLTDSIDEAFFILELAPVPKSGGSYPEIEEGIGGPSSGSTATRGRLTQPMFRRPRDASSINPSEMLLERWVHMSAAFELLFGIPSADLENDPTAWLKVVDREDLPNVAAVFAERQKRPLDITFKIHPGPLSACALPRYVALRSLLVADRSQPTSTTNNNALVPPKSPTTKSSFSIQHPHGARRVLGIFQDISRQKFAEMESQHKTSWVRQVGHEIRNPLAANFTMIHLLLEMDLTADQRDLLLTIRSSNDNLLALINSILDLAKLEAGEMHLEKIPFNLTTQVEDVLDLMAPQAQKKGLRLGGYVDPTVNPWVKGDPLRLRQVIINLFTNAIKFTKSGSVFLRIDLDTNYKDIYHPGWELDGEPVLPLRFSITDTGIGISQEVQSKLFQEFAQADVSTSRQYGGTGLGLSIVRRLVECMSGQVGIISEVGQGATFYFTAVLISQTEEEQKNCLEDEEQQEPYAPVPQVTRPTCVLVISGWELMHEMMDAGVRGMGATLVSAHTVQEGLDMIRERGVTGQSPVIRENVVTQSGPPIDMVILDIPIDEPETRLLDVALTSIPFAVLSTREKRERTKHHLSNMEAAIPGPNPRYFIVMDPVKIRRLQMDVFSILEQRDPEDFQCVWAGRPQLRRESSQAAKLQEVVDEMGPIGLDADGKRIKVMLVEDNPINQKAVSRLLSRLTGEPPLLAGDGQVCLDLLQDLHQKNEALPDIIFMDISMPVMDGLTATRLIMETYTEKQRPAVITMTANALHEDYVLCMHAGADGYLLKPASKEVIRKTMGHWWKICKERRNGKHVLRHSATSLHFGDE
ncbi:hypothetical protein DFS34DRAFT_145500 [Phlyctochytrium arcticum]|nr:hypothetical protein DFS34DRAFT_145500 [Phlyctochytrium arcticum]